MSVLPWVLGYLGGAILTGFLIALTNGIRTRRGKRHWDDEGASAFVLAWPLAVAVFCVSWPLWKAFFALSGAADALARRIVEGPARKALPAPTVAGPYRTPPETVPCRCRPDCDVPVLSRRGDR